MDDPELLRFGLVPVVAPDDAGPGDADGELPPVWGAKQLGEAAAQVFVHDMGPEQLLLGEKAQVSGIELPGKGGIQQREGPLRPAPGEGGQKGQNFPQCNGKNLRNTAEFALAIGGTGQAAEQLLHHIVHVGQMQQLPWILDGDRKLPGRAVAEGSDGAVVVRAAPLAENVRKAVQKNLRTGFCAVAQKDLLGGQLALTVRRGGTGLNGGGEQHRAGTLRQAGEEDFGEVKVPLPKGFRIGSPVYTGQMEDKLRLPAPAGEEIRWSIPVAGQNLGAAGEGEGFQPGQKVSAQKSPGPGDQDLHRRPSLVRRARISGSCSSFSRIWGTSSRRARSEEKGSPSAVGTAGVRP